MEQEEHPAAAVPAGEKRRRLSGAARRAAFLDAAAAIVLERGASAVTMEGVALRTGVDKRLGYRYFGNREELLRALIDRELDEVTVRTRRLLPTDPSYEQRVRSDIRAWLALVEERGPLLARLRSGPDAPAAIGLERPVQEWAERIQLAAKVPPAQAEVLSRMFLAALYGASDALHQGVASLDEIAEIFLTVALAGTRSVAARSADETLAPQIKSR
jgi:AcrR family transcriptional regulator